MPAAIGLRVYRLTIHKRGDTAPLPFAGGQLRTPVESFISVFIEAHDAAVHNEALERSWYFEPRLGEHIGSHRGYTQYGTFGFESVLRNRRTKTKSYERKVNDVEEVPLFYEFWTPEHKDYCLAAFQSFQGRSCIHLVLSDMKEMFERLNPGLLLRPKKMFPSDVHGSIYRTAPVKRLTLIRRDAPSDVTDRYFARAAAERVDFEVSLVAKRRGSLGDLKSLSPGLSRNAAGLVLHDGITFNQAEAHILIGNKVRKVGVFGSESEAGVIDLTDSIEKGANGHPTFESLCAQADSILIDMSNILERN